MTKATGEGNSDKKKYCVSIYLLHRFSGSNLLNGLTSIFLFSFNNLGVIMKSLKNYFLLSVILLFVNCATGLRSALHENMSVTDFQATTPIGNSVFIPFVTGADKDILLTNIEITQALRKSMINSKYFKSLSEKTKEDWDLNAEILRLDKPSFGADFTVSAEIKYTLLNKGVVVKDFAITESGTATLGEEVIGFKRMKVADERCIQNNIKKFLIELNSYAKEKK